MLGGRSFEAQCTKMCTEPLGFSRMLRRRHDACRLFCKKINCKNSTFQVNYVKGLGFSRSTMGLWTISGAFLFLWENFSVQFFTFKDFVGSVGLSGAQILKCQWPCDEVSYLQAG